MARIEQFKIRWKSLATNHKKDKNDITFKISLRKKKKKS